MGRRRACRCPRGPLGRTHQRTRCRLPRALLARAPRGGTLPMTPNGGAIPGRAERSDMAAKILIVTGDAAESLEVLYPYQRLREEGYEVHIAAPTRKKLQFVVHDFEPGFDTYTEKPGYTWPADLAFSEVDPGDYVAIVIPGGRATEYLRNDP